MAPAYILLADRGVIEVAGEDRVAFLQGLVSNDVAKAAPDRALHAALLTAQGRYLHDFFIVAKGPALLLEGEAARLDDLQRRLGLYRLRSKVTLTDRRADFASAAVFGPGALAALGLGDEPGAAREFAGGTAFVDPRLAALGARVLLPLDAVPRALDEAGLTRGDLAAYDLLRLGLGVPDGSRDLAIDKALLVESGFDELHGIDWQKGCYIGQEITARMKYRALTKKRLMPVAIEGPVPPPETPVMLGTEEAGEMRSGRDGLGLALLRLEVAQKAADSGTALTAGAARLMPKKPEWMSS